MAKEPVKSEFVAARFTKAERRKILKLSLLTSEPGSLSAGLRLAVNLAKAPAASEQPGSEAAEAVQYA